MTLPPPAKKLLSIQSHVVHGYVGNRAATFPLQTQGWDVDVLNTVNFSNHTGYGQVYGNSTSSEDIRNLYRGLVNLNVSYNAILTGYIPWADCVRAVGEIINDFKKKSPNSIWLLDPVMGDEGQLYVNEDVIPEYVNILKSRSVDIITPNQFEAELLVGYKIVDLETLKKAIGDIHTKYGVKYVVITSLDLVPSELMCDHENRATMPIQSEKYIYAATSTIEDQSCISLFKIPSIDSYFTGVGDLFSALLLDRIYKTETKLSIVSLNKAINQVLSIMLRVLLTTHKLGLMETNGGSSHITSKNELISKIGDANSMKYFELRIIESKDYYGMTEEYFIGVNV